MYDGTAPAVAARCVQWRDTTALTDPPGGKIRLGVYVDLEIAPGQRPGVPRVGQRRSASLAALVVPVDGIEALARGDPFDQAIAPGTSEREPSGTERRASTKASSDAIFAGAVPTQRSRQRLGGRGTV